MLCKNCGASLPDTAGFCSNCGAVIPKQPQPPQQQPRQQTYTPPQPQTYTQPQQQPSQQQTYTPPPPRQQTYTAPQQPQYQQTQYQQPQYQQPQYQQYPPRYPQKKKSGAGLAVLVAVLAVLLVGAVIWGVSLSKKLKANKPDAQPGVTAAEEAQSKKKPAEPASADPTEEETDEEPGPVEGPSIAENNPVAPDAGAMLGKLEGFWTASDGSAFIRLAAEQYGWAIYVGYYYSDLEVYAHMDGELHRAQNGYYNAHFSEPASEAFPAFDFDLWIDASEIDSGRIRCVMCEEGAPDYENMPVLTFSGHTMEEAAPQY